MMTLIMVEVTKHNSPLMQRYVDQKTEISRDENNTTLFLLH